MSANHQASQPPVRIPSLYEIFRGRLANGIRRIAKWRREGVLRNVLQARRQRAPRIEMLEPRVLLSADISYAAASGVALDAALRITDVDGTQMLQLVDNASSAVLAQEALDEDLDVTLSGAELNDRLVIDFNGTATPYQVNVNFEGGAGEDSLRGPSQDTVWTITGANQGSTGTVTFSGVENLEGAADNEDTFVIGAGGSVSGGLEGGAGGFDSIVVAEGGYSSMVFKPSGPDSGTIALDGAVTAYAGFEPITVGGVAPNIVLDLTDLAGATATLKINTVTAALDDYILEADDGAFESHTFTDPGAGNSVTVNLGAGNDTITLKDIRDPAGLDATITLNATLTVNGGAGNDTYKLDDNWGNNVRLVEAAGEGTADALDFSLFSDGPLPRDYIVIAPTPGGVVNITGEDGSSLTTSTALSADNFEDLTGANVRFEGAMFANIESELVGGLESLTAFVRSVAQVGELAADLPLIGKNADVAVGKALDFAEALDELRLEVEEFFDGIPNVTTDELIAHLNGVFDGVLPKSLAHLGAAVLTPNAITGADIVATDEYKFDLTLDGTTVHVIVNVDAADPTPTLSGGGSTVTVGIAPAGPYTVAQLQSAINAGLSTLGATSGVVAAAERGGRFAFQVLGTEIDSFSVEGLAGAAVSKLGFELGSPTLLGNVQDILRDLGALKVSVANAVTLDTSFETGTPKLRLDVEYRADRQSEFFYNLGDEAQSLGLAFDLEAKIAAEASLVFDFQLGLSLTGLANVDFFLDVDELRAGISTTATAETVSNLGLDIGFLATTASGTLNLDAGVSVDTTGLQNISDPSSIVVTAGDLTLTGSDGTGSPAFSLSLTIGVDTSLSSLGGFSATGTLNFSGDPFADPSTFTFTTSSDFNTKFLDFNNLNAAGVVSLLGEVSGWLDGVRDGELLGSINIPFVEGALDGILDLAEVLSDALLYDEGADDVRDGADKLASDLNAALADAGLGEKIRAQGNGSGITFVAIDPEITAFTVSKGPGDDDAPPSDGFEQLGIVSGTAATTVGGVLRVAGAAGPAGGKLAGNAVIRFNITRNAVATNTDVTLEQSATTDNTGIGDDKAKLLDANNAPTFSTAQGLVDRLSEIITLGTIGYNTTTKVLTYEVSFTDVPLFSVELPTDFALDLSPIGSLQSDTRLVIDASGGIHFTLGFDLSDAPAGSSVLADGTTLESLGVEVKLEEAAVANDAPRTIAGQLSGDAHFSISLNGGAPVALTVAQLVGDPGTDVNASQALGNQRETTIAVNPVNSQNIIVAPNDVPGIFGNTENTGNGVDDDGDGDVDEPALSRDSVWVSTDGGANWVRKVIPLPTGADGGHGDPTIVFSRDGSRVVYVHMTDKTGPHGDHVMASAVSLDGGVTWLAENTGVIGSVLADEDGDGVNDDNDKEFLAVGPDVNDPSDDRFAVTWQRGGVIYASTSTDGIAWSAPVIVGGITGTTTSGSTHVPSGNSIDAIPTFGPNGEIYVVWEDYTIAGVSRIMFDLSLDGGLTWGGGQDTKLFFDTAEFQVADLTPADKAKLDAIADLLIADPQLRVTVAGYTDTQGATLSNQTLSENRANAIADYLTITKGIAVSRVTEVAFGEFRLAHPTADDVADAANRRVELTLDRVVYTGNVNVFNDPFNGNAGLDGADDDYEIPAQPDRGIWMGLSIDVDRSGGANDGRIYIAFADQGDLDGNDDNANATDHHDTDIFVLASDNDGTSWAALGATPVLVNDDLGTASQFFSWIGVDQATGNVALSWYDARNDLDATPNNEVEYFASFSTDGGVTWADNILVSDGMSDASAVDNIHYGDYTGLVFANNTIHMTWTDNSNSTGDNPGPGINTDIYYDRIVLGNETINDLLDDINAAIAATPALAGKIQAQADGNRVKFVAIHSSVTSFSVGVSSNTDPAFRDLGFQLSADAQEDDLGNLVVKAAKNAPTLVGQLTADASFSINLGSGPQTVTVERGDTVSSFAPNRNILDLISDVQHAVDDALGADIVEVSSEGGRLLFTRLGTPVLGTGDDFTVTPISNADELGITGTLTSDEADLVITIDDGTQHRIVLDGVTTIGGVISAINATLDVTASRTVDDPEGEPTPVNEANTGLTLVDNTVPGGPWSGNFKVAKANGSLAGVQLGLIATDTNPQDPEDDPDGKIVGAKIGGATLLDRFFITSSDLTDVIDASVQIQAGRLVEDIEVVDGEGGDVITSSSFEFKTTHVGKQLQLKGTAGFTAGLYTINSVDESTNRATLSAAVGADALADGVAILKTGVQASANFGFVGISLTGPASLGAEVSLGFNTGASELADSKLTLQELVDGLDDVLDLLAPPDIQPIGPATNFGELDLAVSLSAGSADFSALAGSLLGGSPGVSIDVITVGDPFIGTRFVQASYAKVTGTQFTVNGDLTGKLPNGVTLRFDGDDAQVASTSFSAGVTTVNITPDPANPSFVLPDSLTSVDVALLPKVDIATTDLGDLPDFSDLSFEDIIAMLQALAQFLGQFESFGFLNQDLPIIDRSINDLLGYADELLAAIEEAQNNPAGTLQLLETKINEAIGLASDTLSEAFTAVGIAPVGTLTDDVFDLSFDSVNDLLKLDFSLGAGFSEGLDVAIPGIDFGAGGPLAALGLDPFLDLSGSAGLEASGGVLLRLSLGVDVANFDISDPGAHMYILDTTGLDAKLTVGGEDIAFRVGVGPFALSIGSTDSETSEIQIAGTASAGLDASVFSGGKVSFNTIFGNLSDLNFDGSLTGTVTGTLPVFFPNDSTQLGTIRIGGSDGTGAFTATGNLLNLGVGGFEIWTEDPQPSPTANAVVIDVSEVVEGISNFNFDNFSLFDNIFLAIDGIDMVLGFIEDAIDGQMGGFTVPLIGDGLADAAGFIGDLRDDFIAPLREGIEKAKDMAQDVGDADKNIVSKLIYDLLEPLGLLKQQSGDGSSIGDYIGLDTNIDEFLFDPNTTLEIEDTYIEWDLKLGSVLADLSTDIGFDLGIPGLGLETEGDITLNVEWELDFGFGLNFTDGFYLLVGDGHELLFDISVTLPAGIRGTLGFLELRAQDKTIDGKNTELGATFMVDIEESGASGADAQRLGFTEFGSIGLNAGIAAEASASLGLELGLSDDLFVEIFGPGASDVIAGFPKVQSDFVFLWELGTRGSGASLEEIANNSTFVEFDDVIDAIGDGLKKVAFLDVGLDLGSFLSDVLGPIVEEVSVYTEPLQPIIDFIMSPIPIIGDLGLEITWLDLAAALAGDSFDVSLIESIAEIITLINDIAELSGVGEVILPIGDMVVFDAEGPSGFMPSLWDGGLDRSGTFDAIQGTSGLLDDLIGNAGGIVNALGDLASGGGGSGQTASTLSNVVSGQSAGGFHFPFLEDPTQIFGLLMGEPLDLVTYDLGAFNFSFEFRQFFSIFGPLGVSIGLLVEIMADTAFGYDTQGIQDFVESGFRNPLLLFNGFFISDSPKLDGNDDPELTFLAELQAAAELNLGIARAGVAAALGFLIEFDLFDPNDDMKIRLTELAGNFLNQLKAPSDADKLLAPLAIFDVSGEIFARMFAFLEIDFGFFSFEEEFPIFGPVTLLSFEIDFFRPPILASEQDNGDLIIHTGEFADQRLLGNATDIGEHLIIESAGSSGDYVKVKIKAGDGALGEDSQVFQDYRVRKGSKIIIDGGEGNDIFNLSNFTEDGVVFEIDLGVGNDQVLWNNSAEGPAGRFSTIRGGSGDDNIAGSGGSDLIFGDAGNDTINSNGGADLVFGDEGEVGDSTARALIRPSDGRDTINGGGGKDIVFGSGGKDNVQGGDQDDLVIGGGGLVFFNSFQIFDNLKSLSAGGVQDVENLSFDPTAGDTIAGGDGADILFGTAGPDTITGAGGNDKIFGMAGFDSIDAGGGNDIVFGDGGKITSEGPKPLAGGDKDTIQGGAGNDTIFGGGGGDVIQGGDNADTIYGGSGADVIFGDNGSIIGGVPTPSGGGSDGGDKIYGEGEPDKIYGGGGIDEIDGGAGNDFLYGGDDSDLLITNKSSDFLNGQGGSDTYLIDFQGGNAAALTTVIDTGPSTDTDLFVATGTVQDDDILLRANTDGSIAFVAMINDPAHVERINYSFMERVVVNGSFGNDYFASDDTAAEVTLNGEFGDDVFQIGQMFKSDRGDATDANGDSFSDVTGIGVDDIFATIETTRGFLSNGISAPMTINGGLGNDLFTVYHNKAVLQLNGEEGDDTFEIRAFALAGSQEPQRERTDISGGAGADLVQYAVNAPVNIDGGDGFDTVVIIGTEFGDDFVITEDGVFGAGLNVNFVNIESLRVDGAEGNDRFFVKSTSEKFLTEIFGGLGADTFNMSGDTPPIVSNDLKGHSGLIVQDVESADPRFDEQKIFGISANVADNDEPFAVIRLTGGSTIVTEGGVAFDTYQLVLTRAPDKDVLIQALAPIPTPDSRERRMLSFRLDSPTKDSLTLDGTGLTLRFTPGNWYIPQEVRVFADATALSDIAGLFTRPELGDNGGVLPAPFDMDDAAYEGVRFGVVNHLIKAESDTLDGTLAAVNNATKTVEIPDAGATVTTTELLGRKLYVTEGPGAGQTRFIVAVSDVGANWSLTLDRAFSASAVPTNVSKFFISIDDAIVGKMTAFNESPVGLPAISDPNDDRSTFTDTAAAFPTAGEGLTGAILEIIGGPGAGQQRLILGNLPGDPTQTLILNGPWRINPVAGESLYRIERYEGLAIPSVSVQINDNDRPGLIVDETMGYDDPAVVADFDTITAVIEGGDGDHLGEIDVLQVRLNANPGASDVHVGLVFDGAQVELTDLAGNPLAELVFTSADWSTPQPVLVKALTDLVREGFHSTLVEFNITTGSADGTSPQTDTFETVPEDKPVFFVGLSFTPKAGTPVTVTLDGSPLVQADSEGKNGDYIVLSNKIVFVDATGEVEATFGDIVVSYTYTVPGFTSSFTTPVLVRIEDADAPTVVVRETGGTTDVIELKREGGVPESVPGGIYDFIQFFNLSPWNDSYELVLSGAPSGDVTITVTPEITKTTRTGGIRHDAIQVQIFSADARVTPDGSGNLTVTFDATNWDDPVVIGVRALDDAVVDGSDTQVFAPGPNAVSRILGPVIVDGMGGRGTLAFNTPLMLPGELNRRESDGNVVAFVANPGGGTGAIEQLTVETADLAARAIELFGATATIDDLLGLTVEMSKGQGVGVLLDPERPRELYDRFWLITAIENGAAGQKVLTLQNPSQLDVGALAPTDVPNSSSEYAITTLSVNFFVDERTQVDFMFVHDEDSPADSAGFLTSTRLWGLNMAPDLVIGGQRRAGGITYNALEVLEINLGKGNNDFTVYGTHTREDGYQTWTFLNSGDEPVPYMGVQGDTVTVKLNAEEEVTRTGTVSAAENPGVGNGLRTRVTIDGAPLANDALAGQLIRIVEDDDADADGQVRRILGNVGNVLTLDRPWEFLPGGEAYEIVNEADGAFAANLGFGDDELDASASTLGIVAFGGLGDDELTGGGGDDILFGDRGRVDYFNEIGAIVTRLGYAPEPITGFVTTQVTLGTLSTITDTGPKKTGGEPMGSFFPLPDDLADGSGTDDIGLRGLYVDINNGAGFLQTIRLISDNTATTLSLADPFDPDIDLPGPVLGDESEYRISTMPEDQTDGVVRAANLLLTVDNDQGGTDVINAGGGNDQIFGGADEDTISAGEGDDIVIGDSGRIDRSRDPAAEEEPGAGDVVGSLLERVRTIAFDQGETDTLSGNAGADTILGGYGADFLYGDDVTDSAGGADLADIVLGDNGEVTFEDGIITSIFTTDVLATTGGDDTIGGGADEDILIGGVEDDDIDGGADADIVLGDDGTVLFEDGNISSITDPGTDGDDVLGGGNDPDLIIGGLGNDTISGEGNDDILIGDAAQVLYAGDGVTIVRIETIDRTHGGVDTIYGGGDDDIVIGGTNDDDLDGGLGRDLVFGDNVLLVPEPGAAINPRFRVLGEATIYDANGEVQVGAQQAVPGGLPSWGNWHITLDQTLTASHFGDDYIAGGGGNDEIFGQLGDDTIQGDGSIDFESDGNYVAIGDRVGAARDAANALLLNPSFEDPGDGDDYIEGNGGTDVIFGNLGQDDIVGGSSTLFSLTDYSLRPDGKDYIFGGAGMHAGRNDLGDASATGHARDSDVIVGDNGNIYRLVSVGTGGATSYLAFNYDNYGSLKIVPRAAQLLDYTPGGPDYTAVDEAGPADVAINPGTGLRDIGAGDDVHGESGDDFIYGMVGRDVLFGDGQDDNMVGGYGADWMSGGTGDDGMLGDDGRLFASRNGAAGGEPLYGVAEIPGTEIGKLISIPGPFNQAVVNVSGQLKYTADLTPEDLDLGRALAPASPNVLFRPLYANDIIYGGWGDDSIHAGAGEDAVSGAEAPELSYTNNYGQTGSIVLPAVQRSDFDRPYNPGNVLGYNPATTKFALYDATAGEGMRKILLNPATGSLWKGPAAGGANWLLNFDDDDAPLDAWWASPATGYAALPTDGDDHLFGDLGNDWLIGGTGRDVMFSGWGDDLMNADDFLDTNGGLNNGFDAVNRDTNPSHEDLAFGGAGRDVIILNTNGDRGFDWVGEYNTFLTPYAQFGAASVNRLLMPQLPEYLYALSKSAGADPTLLAQYGGDPARNGEPFGELGLVKQGDAAWQAQTGAPRDPQAGNTHGGKVDVRNNPGTTNALPIYQTASGPWSEATSEADYLTEAQLAPVVEEAKVYWGNLLGGGDSLARLDGIRVNVGNLPQDRLGATIGSQILIDSDAAGRGWITQADGSAYGRYDLLSVVTHELGHALGLDHDDAPTFGVMGGSLESGMRYALDVPGPVANAGASTLKATLGAAAWNASQAASGGLPDFDLGFGHNGVAKGRMDWQAPEGEGWGVSYTPYAPAKSGKDGAGNFSEFLVKMLRGGDAKGSAAGASAGFDGLGASLFGKKGKTGRG